MAIGSQRQSTAHMDPVSPPPSTGSPSPEPPSSDSSPRSPASIEQATESSSEGSAKKRQSSSDSPSSSSPSRDGSEAAAAVESRSHCRTGSAEDGTAGNETGSERQSPPDDGDPMDIDMMAGVPAIIIPWGSSHADAVCPHCRCALHLTMNDSGTELMILGLPDAGEPMDIDS